MAQGRVILSASIEIANNSGEYRVEYAPATNTNPLDYIRLAVLYVSTMHDLCIREEPFVRQGVDLLFESFASLRSPLDVADIRRRAASVASTVASSIADKTHKKFQKVEKYTTRLECGEHYSVHNKFSLLGFVPNACNSAAFLCYDVARRLEDSQLKLCAEALFRLTNIVSIMPDGWDANTMGFVAAEGAFRNHPEIVAPGMVHPNLNDLVPRRTSPVETNESI